ncbi:MAG: 2-hydroxyacid dehydrogenase [Gammaproteobacteria bacterium]
MTRAVVLDLATITRGDLDLTALDAALPGWVGYPVTRGDELHARIADAAVVLTNKIKLDRAALEAARDLKLICLAATGTNNIDLDAAAERGIAVCNIRAYCTASVAQHVFALVLALTINIPGYRKLLDDGAWRDSPQFCLLDYPIRELAGKTFGVIGYGELGRAAARIAEAFGMVVVVADRPGAAPQEGRLPLDELLAIADVVSLHCPLTPATRGLIDAIALQRMKHDALLINTARGALIDEAALADALRAGIIGGAGIDVLSEEPPVNGNPLLDAGIPNLIVTPHIAWAAREARQRAIDEMAANARAFLAGEHRNRVI